MFLSDILKIICSFIIIICIVEIIYVPRIQITSEKWVLLFYGKYKRKYITLLKL